MVTSHRVAWPGHYLVTGGGGDRTIDAGSPRGGSPAAPAGAVTTEGMETGATATTTRVWSLTQIFAFSLLLHNSLLCLKYVPKPRRNVWYPRFDTRLVHGFFMPFHSASSVLL